MLHHLSLPTEDRPNSAAQPFRLSDTWLHLSLVSFLSSHSLFFIHCGPLTRPLPGSPHIHQSLNIQILCIQEGLPHAPPPPWSLSDAPLAALSWEDTCRVPDALSSVELQLSSGLVSWFWDHQIIQELTSVTVLYNCVAQRLWADRSQTNFLGWTPPSAALPITSYATYDKVLIKKKQKTHLFAPVSPSIKWDS